MSKSKVKSAVKNELAIGNQFTTQDVLARFQEELASLKAITESVYITTGDTGIGGIGNIKDETKIENLIKAFSSINGREEAYIKAASELGITEYPMFTVGGGTSKQWKQDINLRMDVIRYADRKAELEAILEEAKTFLTKEDQFQMFLQKAAKVMNK